MELVFFGINVLLVFAVWHFMLRPTVLDHSRDRLFDLRDELRLTFIKNGWDLASPEYKKLRDLVNGHLWFTEEISVMRVSVITAGIKQDDELQSYLKERLEKMFAPVNPAQKTFILEFRKRALTVVMNYAVFSSGWLLIMALCLLPFMAFTGLFKMLNRQVDLTMGVCLQKLQNFGRYASSSLSISTSYVARFVLAPDVLESYSYKRGMQMV